MPKIHPKQAHGLAEQADETGFRNHFAGLAAYPAEVRDETKPCLQGQTQPNCTGTIANNLFLAQITAGF